MVAERIRTEEWRRPGCDDRCRRERVIKLGILGYTVIDAHSPEAHEEYGRVLCSHAGADRNEVVASGPLRIDLRRLEATLDGRPLGLTPTERKLLIVLARSAGRTIPVRPIVGDVWGQDTLSAPWPQNVNVLRTTIWRMRRVLGRAGSLVVNVPGHGYRLEVVPAGSEPPPYAHHRASGFLPTGRWAAKFDRCRQCGRDDRPHEGRGLCRPCHSRERQGRKAGRSDGAP